MGRGDREVALTELYRRYERRLYGFGVRLLGDQGLAEELVQETFLRVWRTADRFDPARAGASTFVFAITRRPAIDLWRRPSSRPFHPESEQVAEPDALIDPGRAGVARPGVDRARARAPSSARAGPRDAPTAGQAPASGLGRSGRGGGAARVRGRSRPGARAPVRGAARATAGRADHPPGGRRRRRRLRRRDRPRHERREDDRADRAPPPAAPAGHFYTCWLVADGDTLQHQDRVSVGSFVRPDSGSVTLRWETAADLGRYPHLGVTLEPDNGVPFHQGPKVLTAA